MTASPQMFAPWSSSWGSGNGESKASLTLRMAVAPRIESQPAATNATATSGPEIAGDLQTPWREDRASFSNWAEAKAMIARPSLLNGWAKSAREMLSMVDATAADVLHLSDAWGVSSNCGPLNIYFIGEAGGGKSTLVRALAEGIAEIPKSVAVSATVGTAQNDTHVPLPSGLVLVDTQGFRIPVPPADPANASVLDRLSTKALNGYMHRRQVSRWLCLLSDLRLKFEAAQPSQQPAAAVVFVHKAGARIAVDRIAEALAVPVQSNIPTFIALTDIHSVDERDLSEIRQSLESAASLVKPGKLRRTIPLLQINSASKSVQGVEIEPSGLPELVTELLNSLGPEDILRHAKRPQHEASSGAMLVLSLVSFGALILSGHPGFAFPLAGATALWRRWAARSRKDQKAHSAARSGGSHGVRRSSAAARTVASEAAVAVLVDSYSQTAEQRRQKARVEQKGPLGDEFRTPNKKIDRLHDIETDSEQSDVQALNRISASSPDIDKESVRQLDSGGFVQQLDGGGFTDASQSTWDQVMALDRLAGGRRRRWPFGWPSSSQSYRVDDNPASMSTKDQIRALESYDRKEKGLLNSLFGRRIRQDSIHDYPVQGLRPLDTYEAEAWPYQPMPAKSAEIEASATMEAPVSVAEEAMAAAGKDALSSTDYRDPLSKGTAAVEYNSQFSDSSEELNPSLDIDEVETTPAVADPAELAEMEARWSTIVNSQEETLQEVLETATRLEAEVTKAKSRIEELEEDLLLCRCRLVTEKPGAVAAVSADDRTTGASDEASSGGLELPPRVSE